MRLNPSDATFETLRPMLADANKLAVKRHRPRVHGGTSAIGHAAPADRFPLLLVVPCDVVTTRTERNDRLQLLDGLLDELEELNLRDVIQVPDPLAQRLASSGVLVLGGTVAHGLTAVWTEQSRRGPRQDY